MLVQIEVGQDLVRDEFLSKLVEIQYERSDAQLKRGSFRVRGNIIDFFPSYGQNPYRIQYSGDRIERIGLLDAVHLTEVREVSRLAIYPAKHFVTSRDRIDQACGAIREELIERVRELIQSGKELEAKRLESRTRYDLEMLREVGYCAGIENYTRHISGRSPGARPYTLLDYFPKGYLTLIDESHQTVPQIRGMYQGDQSRKRVLVEHGFRLPSALDNRPLQFAEFERLTGQTVYVSATPASYEMLRAGRTVEQLIRPTGLMDPVIEVRRTEGQIDDLIQEIKSRAQKKGGKKSIIFPRTRKLPRFSCASLRSY